VTAPSTGRYVVSRHWQRWVVTDLADNSTSAGPFDARIDAERAASRLNKPPTARPTQAALFNPGAA
jgi:hypothetical protein